MKAMKLDKLKKYIDDGLLVERTHPDYSYLKIYNYSNRCQSKRAWDDITLSCRGLIVDTRTNKILARTFDKFFNYEEKDHIIPDEKPVINEKYDGSLGILYWLDDKPYIATRGSFDSEQANWANEWFKENVKDYSVFNKNVTYLFEIIYPQNKIVVNYDFSGLVFLGMRNIKTGKESVTKLPEPFVSAKEYDHEDIKTLQTLERNNAEGFVVFYPSAGLRIKFKFKEYVRLHRIITGITPKRVWECLKGGDGLVELMERMPEEFLEWLNGVSTKILTEFKEIESVSLKEYEGVDKSKPRKEQALQIKKLTYPKVCFSMLSGKNHKDLIWRMIKPSGDNTYKQEI